MKDENSPAQNAGRMNPAQDSSHADATLDPKIQDAIGRSLKAHYDDIASAPIPDRFLALLAELEAKEQRNGD